MPFVNKITGCLLSIFAAGCLFLTCSSAPVLAQSGKPVSPDPILSYLQTHPETTAVASFTVTEHGEVDAKDPAVFYNPDVRLPLASTKKVLLLAAYARAVSLGLLASDEAVLIADWEAYYLPGEDGGAHSEALTWLKIPQDDYGFALDPHQTVTLDQMMAVMIRFSDNAAPDYLIEKLGDQFLADTVELAGMTRQDLPLTACGLSLSWESHESGPLTEARVQFLAGLSPEAFRAEVFRLTERFKDPVWKLTEFEWRLAGNSTFNPAIEIKAIDALAEHGTVRDYTTLLSRVLSGRFVSPVVCQLIRKHLEWPMEIPEIRQGFAALGEKGGSFGAGVLTDTLYCIPRTGDFGNKTRITVIFLHKLSRQEFKEFYVDGKMFGFELQLAVDRKFAKKTRKGLKP